MAGLDKPQNNTNAKINANMMGNNMDKLDKNNI